MTVVVELFGQEANLVGRDRVRITFSEDAVTCEQLRARLGQDHPEIAPQLRTARFAVNHAFAGQDRVVRESDEVALIGMVSGG